MNKKFKSMRKPMNGHDYGFIWIDEESDCEDIRVASTETVLTGDATLIRRWMTELSRFMSRLLSSPETQA